MIWLPCERDNSELEACLQTKNEKNIDVSYAFDLFERKRNCFRCVWKKN